MLPSVLCSFSLCLYLFLSLLSKNLFKTYIYHGILFVFLIFLTQIIMILSFSYFFFFFLVMHLSYQIIDFPGIGTMTDTQ